MLCDGHNTFCSCLNVILSIRTLQNGCPACDEGRTVQSLAKSIEYDTVDSKEEEAGEHSCVFGEQNVRLFIKIGVWGQHWAQAGRAAGAVLQRSRPCAHVSSATSWSSAQSQ